MKKILSILLVLAMMLMNIAALAEEGAADPIPEPTSAPAAVPVGEAGAPYVGMWQVVTIEVEGEAYSPAFVGMGDVNLTLNADGTAELFDGESTETGTWTIENGEIMTGGAIASIVPMTIADDGTLVMEVDDIKLIFAKAEGEAAPSTAITELAAVTDAAAHIGTWNAVTIEVEGEAYSVVDNGLEIYVTLNADGTAESYDGEIAETGTWAIENGEIIIGEIEGILPMTAADDGTLVMEEDGMKLIFVKANEAAAPSAAVSEPVAVTGDAVAYVGTWNADTAEMYGETFPMEMLGQELRINLYADGTADAYDGETTETGTWTLEDGVIVIDDVLLAVTEDGRLMLEHEDAKIFFVNADAAPSTAVTEPAAVTGAAAAYVGTWQVDTIEMDGETYTMEMLGERYINLYADGTVDAYNSQIGEASGTGGTWTIENGVLFVEGRPLLLCEDGRLLMEDEDSKLYFVKANDDAVPSASVTGAAAAYVGTWRADTVEMDGETYTMEMLGEELYIGLYADGTADSYGSETGDTRETGTWTLEDGVVMVDDTPLVVTEDGRLMLEDEDLKMFFVKANDDAVPSAAVSEPQP